MPLNKPSDDSPKAEIAVEPGTVTRGLTRLMHMFRTTKAEIYIGATLIGLLAGGLRYNAVSKRAGEIPLAFSERGDIQEKLERQGQAMGPLTNFLTLANDTPMKTFESNNKALSIGKGNSVFARELETRIDPAQKVYPLVTEHAAVLPQAAQEALKSLHKIVDAQREIPAIGAAFEAAWDEDHDHKYKTEYYTDRECTGSGEDRKCRNVTKSRSVYSHTIHSYTYKPQQAAYAARLLNDFVARHPDLNTEERLQLATETHADNEQAIEKSRRRILDGRMPTPQEYLAYANVWATGSTLTKRTPAINQNYADLKGLVPAWNAALRTARSDSYRTYSRSDSGPREYQIAETAISRGRNITNNTAPVIESIQYTAQSAPRLASAMKEFAAVVLDGKPGNAKKLRAEIMDISRNIYNKNFEGGEDVQPFKPIDPFLFLLLGVAAGAAAGFCADVLVEKHRQNSKILRESNPYSKYQH